MKYLLLFFAVLISLTGYSQMNTFGGIGLRVNDTTTYQTNAAAFHTAGYYDIYFNNQATNDHWDIWNGSGYDHIFSFASAAGSSVWGGITGTLSAQTDLQTALNLKSPLLSPTFTGIPAAPTAATTVNTTQLATMAALQARVTKYYLASGTGTYTVTVDGITAYGAGQVFDVTFSATNAADGPTLNVNGQGARTLTKHGVVSLVSGDVVPNLPYRVYDNGTTLQLQNQLGIRVFNVEGYGVKHDYRTVSDANVTSGTATLTSATAAFTGGPSTGSIRVSGAGVAGVDLLTTFTVVNATTATLGTNASTTISAKRIEWGTDDTANIQIAIADCFARGGGIVYFPNGIYFLAGPLITSVNSVNPNAQIYIPLSNDATVLKTVVLLGESCPILPRGPFADQNEPTTGVIWKSVIVGAGTTPAVLGSSFANDGFVDANKTIAFIENIAIRVNSIVGVTHSASTMTAFKLYALAAKQVKNCYAYIESTPTLSVVPTNVTYGFWLSQQGHSDNHSYYQDLTSVGFYYAFRFEEHDKGMGLNAYTSLHAFAISGNSSGHPIVFTGNLTANWCRYGLVFLAARTVDLHYYAERWPGTFGTKWFDGVADIYVPSSVAIQGRIRGTVALAGGGAGNLVTSGTYTGNLSIEDIKAMPVTTQTLTSYSVAGSIISTSGSIQSTATTSDGIQVIAGHATNRIGFYAQNTNAGGQATHYMENNRGSLATYGGLLLGGSTNAIGNLFGVSRADKLFVFADGASNLGMGVGTLASQPLIFGTDNTERGRFIGGGQFGLGLTAPTAILHLKAGTTTASTAPLKFTSGTNMTTAEAGAVEFDGTNYFVTSSTTRYTLAKTLTATAVLDFPNTLAQTDSDLTITVTGAADGDPVVLGVPNGSALAGSCYTAWVSAANTVTVRFSVYGLAAKDPASGTFRVSVLKY